MLFSNPSKAGETMDFKGVFLILSVAERLEKALPGQFLWRIVGSGATSEALARQIEVRKLGRAAIKAETDSADSFAGAFRRLVLDPEHYNECQRATVDARAQFYDRSQGLGAMLRRAIDALA
jgi:hypothetical protein